MVLGPYDFFYFDISDFKMILKQTLPEIILSILWLSVMRQTDTNL